jgi:ubiquinone/menaquinone biosynthesis C-methylase UbiE
MNNLRSNNYQKYNSKNPLVRFLIHNFLRTIANLVESIVPQKILDVGCGEGFVIRHLLTQNEKLIIEGIDQDEDALQN